MINIKLLQEKVNKVVANDTYHQVKAIVQLRVSENQLYVTFSFPYSGEKYQQIISLSSEVAQDEIMLSGYLCYEAGRSNEWRSIREKVRNGVIGIISAFGMDKTDL